MLAAQNSQSVKTRLGESFIADILDLTQRASSSSRQRCSAVTQCE